MRNPFSSLDRVPGARNTGKVIHDILIAAIQSTSRLLEPCRARFQNQHTNGFRTQDIADIRETILTAINGTRQQPSAGIQANVVEAYVQHSGDPDTDLAKWLRQGAPLGVSMPVTSRGVFPPSRQQGKDWAPGLLASDPRGWQNYRSADDDPEVCLGLLRQMVRNNWAREATSWQSLLEVADSCLLYTSPSPRD